MKIRKSEPQDLERILEIYAYARRFMAEHGNPDQWGPTCWPPESLVRSDIAAGNSYDCLNGAGNIIGTFFFVLAQVSPEPIVALFGIDEELAAFAAIALRIYVIWFAGVGYQVVGSSYFQSSGQPLKATILELTRQILFLIPLYLLFPPFALFPAFL